MMIPNDTSLLRSQSPFDASGRVKSKDTANRMAWQAQTQRHNSSPKRSILFRGLDILAGWLRGSRKPRGPKPISLGETASFSKALDKAA